jgi:protein tyrosine/serine phosphatase
VRLKRILLNTAWLFLLVLGLCSCVTQQIYHGIPNLAQVEPGVWRGGQPDSEGWRYLKSLGIKRDIKLNTIHEASDAVAISSGMEVIYLPINLEQMTIAKPDPSQLNTAIAAIKPDGTYVHCERGQDRTGLIVGVYRVKVEHWTKADAYQEMLKHGFHPILRGLCWSWQEDVP